MTGRRVAAAAMVVLTSVLAGCGSDDAPARIELDVPYRPDARLDVHVPSQRGAPVIVTLHGCCGGKHDLTGLAHGLAEEGALVFNASWADPHEPGTYPAAYERAACAVRFARVHAGRYGGDPSRVTVLGWSDGAMVAAVVAMAPGDMPSGPCHAPPGARGADAFVGVGGFLGWRVGGDGAVDPMVVNPRTAAFFGGSPDDRPKAWAAGNPYVHLGERPDIDIHLVVGSQDELVDDNRRFAETASRAGHHVRLVVTPEGGTQTIVAPRTLEGRSAVQVAIGAARGGAA